jgi:predicted nucleotidyltransferase
MTDESIPPSDLHPRIILLGLSGSRLYGTDHADSDYDWRGIFQSENDELLGVDNPADTISTKVPDTTLYEVGKFIRLCLKANPNLLELLWMQDYAEISTAGRYLVANRDLFLASETIKTSYGGFAISQIKQLEKLPSWDDKRKVKLVRHAFRVIHQGRSFLLGTPFVHYEGASLEWLLAHEKMPREDVMELLRLDLDILHTQESDLPEQPDRDKVNEVLLNIRHLDRNYG